MPNSYARFDAGEPSEFKTERLAKSRSGSRRTRLGVFVFDFFTSAALPPPNHRGGVRDPPEMGRCRQNGDQRGRGGGFGGLASAVNTSGSPTRNRWGTSRTNLFSAR